VTWRSSSPLTTTTPCETQRTRCIDTSRAFCGALQPALITRAGALCFTPSLSSWAACTTSTFDCQVSSCITRNRNTPPPCALSVPPARCHRESRVAAGRNDDPLLFVKVLQRQLAGMAAADAVAPARLFSAMRNLAAFANDARSGIVADDADLFCKLQSELQRGSTVVAASSVAAAPTKVPRDIGGLPAES
jgi:hypothetical protein